MNLNISSSLLRLRKWLHLSRFGISVNPYILYWENQYQDEVAPPADSSFQRVTANNCEQLASFFGAEGEPVTDWLVRLEEGEIGLTMHLGDEIVGYTWANLEVCERYNTRTILEPHQAYLRDTYISKSFRGRRLAVIIRQAMYRELLELGKTDFISVSDYINAPAKKFKEHLGAVPREFRVTLQLLHRWHADVILRRY